MKSALNWHFSRWLVLAAVNIMYFSLVNPEGSKSAVLFGGFLVLAIDIFLLLKLFLLTIARLTGKPALAKTRSALLGTVVSVVLLALQSIGQLSVRDAVAVLCVGVIFLFYSSYYRFGQRS